jgi:parallel beta-helix repeat protein
METKKRNRKLVVSVLALGSILTFLAFCMAGDSDVGMPPEPPILAEAQPIPSLPYTINQPGSYYFTQNLTHTDRYTNAIEVNADNVTIDLAGYSLIGPSATSGTSNGIHMNGRRNVEIRNGTITGFGNNGVYEENQNDAKGHRVTGVRVVSNGGNGILLAGGGHLITSCTASLNCLAEGDWWGGIRCGYEATVTCNVVNANSSSGIVTDGGCMISENTIAGNSGVGINAFYGCTVTRNTISGNFHGIYANADGILVKENTVRWTQDAGIFVRGTHNAIEENLTTACNVGIYFQTSGHFYANNRAFGNTLNYGGSVPTGSGDGGGNIQFGTLVAGTTAELQMNAMSVAGHTSGTE